MFEAYKQSPITASGGAQIPQKQTELEVKIAILKLALCTLN
jgi:hypothetical protein